MTGESDEMFKSNIEGCLHEHSERNPLLISGTKVNEGTGEMLVLNGISLYSIYELDKTLSNQK